MLEDYPLFQVVIAEVSKTLLLVDLELARDYSRLLPDEAAREEIFGMIEAEFHRTRDVILELTGRERLEEPYEVFHGRVRARLPLLRTVGRQQVTLIRSFREKGTSAKDIQSDLVPLLLSINCIAAGLGWTA